MKILFTCLFFGFSVIAYAHVDLTLNVNVSDPIFIVTLPANPSTGFQWSVVSFNKNLLALSDSSYEKSNPNLIGSGGQMHFTFMLKKEINFPKSTEIVLKYARSWEPGSATLKKVKVNFLITGGQ